MYRDGSLLEGIRAPVPEWFAVVAAIVTQLGDVWFVLLLGFGAAVATARRFRGDATALGRPRGPWHLGVILGGILLTTALKYYFELPRPDVATIEPGFLPTWVASTYGSVATASGYGFPSGHAVAATVAYGLFALSIDRGTRRLRVAVAGLVVAAVSLTRLVLGVHYPLDVVAGIAIGGCYLAATWWLLARSPVDRTITAFAIVLGLTVPAVAGNSPIERVALIAALAGGVLATWPLGASRAGLDIGSAAADRARSGATIVGAATVVAVVAVAAQPELVVSAALLGALAALPSILVARRASDGRRIDRRPTATANAGRIRIRRGDDASHMPDDSRELGVELGDVQDDLKNEDYPISHDDLIDEYGDQTVEMSGETTTLGELIGPLGEDEYADYGEVESAIMNMVGDEAIGRKNYSDRTPPASGEQRQDEGAPGQEGQQEQESF